MGLHFRSWEGQRQESSPPHRGPTRGRAELFSTEFPYHPCDTSISKLLRYSLAIVPRTAFGPSHAPYSHRGLALSRASHSSDHGEPFCTPFSNGLVYTPSTPLRKSHRILAWSQGLEGRESSEEKGITGRRLECSTNDTHFGPHYSPLRSTFTFTAHVTCLNTRSMVIVISFLVFLSYVLDSCMRWR